MTKLGVLSIVLGAAVVAGTATAETVKLTRTGTGFLQAGSRPEALPDDKPAVYREGPETNRSFQKYIKGATNLARVPSTAVPMPKVLPVSSVTGAGFDGLTHRDQRFADGGNQFSLEPPDQGFAIGGTTECNGGPCVLEAVNNAIAAYDTAGTSLGFASMHQFFGLPSEFVRPNGPYGPFLSDPKIYFDWASGRWFVTELEIDQDPVTGDFTGRSHVLIAVSATSNPVGSYAIYVLDTTNDGTSGTPSHADCPCFGDQPLIGADANGFYISTNEFPLFAAGFNGAQIYALDKAALVAFGGPNVVLFSPGALAEGIAYSVQPAVVPPGGSYESANGGTQYFLSSLEFFGGLDNRIAVWAMTNTSSLASSPSLTLQKVVVQNTLIYGQPPAAQQPNISVSQICSDSLFMVVGCGLLDGSLEGFPISVKAPLIQSNDDRMNQVTFAAGKLWGAVNTVVKAKNGPTRTAAAWMAFTPGFSGSTLTASYAGGGYVAVNNSSVLFPSLAVNAAGQGAIGFSLVGATGWPSTAYAKVSLSGGATAVKVTAQGAFPDDGFTGYPVFDNRTGRWGDYSAASIGPDGNVWMANEYIPYANRSLLANWGTFVHHVAP